MLNNASFLKLWLQYATLILIFISAHAQADFSGSARHDKKQVARQDALTDLQQNIYVNVESHSLILQSSDSEDVYEFSTSVSSTIPLLGSHVECYKKNKQWQCDSELKRNVSTELYLATIKQKQDNIDKSWQQIQTIKTDQQKYIELKKLLQLQQENQQLILVLKILNPDVKPPQQNTVNSTQISNEIALLEESAKSLTMAADLLGKQIIDKNNILIKVFLPYHSQDITPFSSALQNQLNNKLNTVNNTEDADFTLQGKYRINKSNVQVETQLINKQGKIINTEVVLVEKSALTKHPFEPKDSSFEQMLLTGQIISDDLTVKLATNHGTRELLFRNNETLRLIVKVNKPSYFYIISHTTNDQEKLSYLLDLNDSVGDNKFVQYLGVDEVNKWVEIAEFDIAEPFGKEQLQLFASTTEPLDLLPAHQYDGMYYRIKGTKKNVMQKTRGFIRKKKKVMDDGKEKREIAEAVLSITTEE